MLLSLHAQSSLGFVRPVVIVLLNFKEKKFLLKLHSLGFGPFQCFQLVHRSMWLPNHFPSDISAGNFTFKVEMSKTI